jgi:hypothetical protein
MKPRSSFAALLVAAFLVPLPALAAGPSAADRATARALAADAHKAFDNKDYATAAERFARADALVHAPTLLLGLGRAQAALGKVVAANESFNQILREGVQANAPKVWADAVEEARRELAAITPRLSWVTLNVNGAAGKEERIKVLLDGVEVPSAAIGVPRAVDAGQHLATVTVDYGKGSQGTVNIGEGKSQTLTLEVKIEDPPPGVKLPPHEPGPGIGPGVPQQPDVPYSPLRRNAGFVTLGLGGAGIVMGAITGGLVLSMHGSLASSCPGGKCPASQQGKLDSYNALGAASTGGFIGGAVLAGVGVVLVLTAPKAPARAALTVLPTLGGGALGAVGSF